jgi:hypothetical protein
MALKFILKLEEMQAFVSEKVVQEHKESWDMFRFGLEVVALLGFVYLVHILIHNYLFVN